jgi:hypothetical protein
MKDDERIDARLYKNLHGESDAFVCPTNLTVESLTKARAGEFWLEISDFARLVIVYGPCVILKIRFRLS